MFEVIKNILINYWQPIIGVVCLVVSFILQLIKKKPINDVISYIYDFAVSAVKIAENSGVSGPEKLTIAYRYIANCLKNVFPEINISDYDAAIITIIESILETPQKRQKVDIEDKVRQLHEALKERKI